MSVKKSNRSYLRDELSRSFIPYLQSLGFGPRNPTKNDARGIFPLGVYVRKVGFTADVVEVQFDKYSRPRFIINFRKGPPRLIQEGPGIGPRRPRLPVLTEFGREKFQWAESFRLTPRPQSARWFTMGTFFGLRSPEKCSKEVVDRLMSLFPQVEAWFKEGMIGDHIQELPILVPIVPETQNH